ncbi:hypothetical protein XENOCAPTIV_002919, partial [Xenoophorus captivus]
ADKEKLTDSSHPALFPGSLREPGLLGPLIPAQIFSPGSPLCCFFFTSASQPTAMGEARRASKQPTLSCSTCSCRFSAVPKVFQAVLGDILTWSCRWAALDRSSWCQNVDWNSLLG